MKKAITKHFYKNDEAVACGSRHWILSTEDRRKVTCENCIKAKIWRQGKKR